MPTATPVPEYLDYDQYGDDIARQLNNYRGDEEWAVGFGNHVQDGVGVAITKPEGWTVQDAEMEGAREVARMSIAVPLERGIAVHCRSGARTS